MVGSDLGPLGQVDPGAGRSDVQGQLRNGLDAWCVSKMVKDVFNVANVCGLFFFMLIGEIREVLLWRFACD